MGILILLAAVLLTALTTWLLMRPTGPTQRTEEWFRTAVENMPDCFGVFTAIRDAEGRIIDFSTDYLNPPAAAYNFTEGEQQVSTRRFELLPFHREIGLFEEYCLLVETGKPLLKESVIEQDGLTQENLRAGNLIKAFDIRATRLGDGFAVTWRDITERKRDEHLILEQQKMMIFSSKMSALGEMAGGIAHEINNPLAIIHGVAEDLKDSITDNVLSMEKVIAASGRIEATAMRIHRIVHGLRSFARDDRGESHREVRLAQIVDETLSFCRERYHNHGIRLDTDRIPESLGIQGSATQISQVLLNLLNNAHDAVEKLETRWVKVAIDQADGKVKISVTDSGTGIPAEIRDKVLQPFFSTKPEGQGTGLGLSISKGIVESHGGTLALDVHCPNTRFVVTLPKNMENLS